MLALKMKQGFALALALVSVAAVSVAQRADSADGRPCLVANESSHRHFVSLQQGLDAAAAGDTLVVMGTCVGNFVINKNLTLEGVSNPGFGEPTLDGGGSSGSVLAVGLFLPVTVALDNLTILHGATGISLEGLPSTTVNVSGTTVTDNGVGIVCVTLGCQASLTDSSVSGNTGLGMGGRMSSTILRSSVSDNGATGIGVSRGGPLILTDSRVSGNGQGGIAAFQSSVQISGSTISGNTGSGLALFEAGASLINSTVSGNSTSGSGGGINVVTGGFSLTDSTVSGNAAGGNGGGIYLASSSSSGTLTDSTVSGNTASSGGGIFNNGGSVTLSGTNTFLNNVPDDCVAVAGC